MEQEKLPSSELNFKNLPGVFDSSLALDIQNIPSKISFKIGEVARLLKVQTHILRYWEKEFESFAPKKRLKGQRLYFRKDVETALLIKKLLYRDGFSVKGAKKALQPLKKENRQYKQQSVSENKVLKTVQQMQKNIYAIKELIK